MKTTYGLETLDGIHFVNRSLVSSLAVGGPFPEHEVWDVPLIIIKIGLAGSRFAVTELHSPEQDVRDPEHTRMYEDREM